MDCFFSSDLIILLQDFSAVKCVLRKIELERSEALLFFYYNKLTNLDSSRQLEPEKSTSSFGPQRDYKTNSFLGKIKLDCQVCLTLHSTSRYSAPGESSCPWLASPSRTGTPLPVLISPLATSSPKQISQRAADRHLLWQNLTPCLLVSFPLWFCLHALASQ